VVRLQLQVQLEGQDLNLDPGRAEFALLIQGAFPGGLRIALLSGGAVVRLQLQIQLDGQVLNLDPGPAAFALLIREAVVRLQLQIQLEGQDLDRDPGLGPEEKPLLRLAKKVRWAGFQVVGWVNHPRLSLRRRCYPGAEPKEVEG